MPGWKEYRGGATDCVLQGGITASSNTIEINGVVGGWPSGLHPFVIVIDPQTAREERILCSSLTGENPATIAVLQRGYDDTSAVDHDPNAVVQHCWDADSAATFAAHAFDTERDDHEQYMPVDGSRAFTDMGGVAGTPVAVGTANDGGSANTVARSDHVHKIGDGAIDDPAMFAAAVVQALAVAAASISESDLQPNSVGTPELIDAAVTFAKIGFSLALGSMGAAAVMSGGTYTFSGSDHMIASGAGTLPDYVFTSLASRRYDIHIFADFQAVNAGDAARLRARSHVGGAVVVGDTQIGPDIYYPCFGSGGSSRETKHWVIPDWVPGAGVQHVNLSGLLTSGSGDALMACRLWVEDVGT